MTDGESEKREEGKMMRETRVLETRERMRDVLLLFMDK